MLHRTRPPKGTGLMKYPLGISVSWESSNLGETIMSKFYTLRSMDGQRSLATVTKQTARGMVRRGEACYVPGCSVVQLVPPVLADPPANSTSAQNKPCSPTDSDFRGLSARAHLAHRYLAAKESHSNDGLAREVIAAVDGLPAVKGVDGETAIAGADGWRH
jgi:hypothetical protein